ncbi:MAG: hypothetical protein QM811_19430 [Pirellulales bacterium]
MSLSILDAIKLGQWDYEPELAKTAEFPATEAMPGTVDKLEILAQRLQRGQPLWHPNDRIYWRSDDDRN